MAAGKPPRGGKRSPATGGEPDGDIGDVPAKPRARKPAAARSDKPPAAKAAKPAAAKTAKSPAGKTARPATGKPADAAAPRAKDGPSGFGGWLWLLAIGQLVVTARMIDTLMKMARLVGTELWDDHPALVATDLGLYGAALMLQVAVLAAMALGRRLFVPLFLVSIVAFFLIGRIEPLLAIVFLGMDPSGLASRAVLLPMAIELGVGIVWGAYVLRSRRVRNTFVR